MTQHDDHRPDVSSDRPEPLDGFALPAAHDLPPGRLEQRRAHLVRELSAAPRRARRRTRAALLIPAAAVVGVGSAWAAGAFDAHPLHTPDKVECYAAASLTAQHTPAEAAVGAGGPRTPGQLCAPFFARGYLNGGGTAVPRLVTCVGGGTVRVFPARTDAVCARLGLDHLPDTTYRAELERIRRMFRIADTAIVHGRGGTVEVGASGEVVGGTLPDGDRCLRGARATVLVHRALERAGLHGVRLGYGDRTGPRSCVEDVVPGSRFDGHTVLLSAPYEVPAQKLPPVRTEADRARACRSPRDGSDLLDAVECVLERNPATTDRDGFPCATPAAFRAAGERARDRGGAALADWRIEVTGGRGAGQPVAYDGLREDGRIRVLTVTLSSRSCRP